MNFVLILEILEDICQGCMVVIVDDEDCENEGDLIMVVELVKLLDINFMVIYGCGLVCLLLICSCVVDFGLVLMVQVNIVQFQINFMVSIEVVEGVIIGILVYDCVYIICIVVKFNVKLLDLYQLGYIFLLIVQLGGVFICVGYIEVGVDLVMLVGLELVGVLVEILNLDGSMVCCLELEVFVCEYGLKMGFIVDLIVYCLVIEKIVECVDECEIDIEFGLFKLVIYCDCIVYDLYFVLVCGMLDVEILILVCVQVENLLVDLLYWCCDDFGVVVIDVLCVIDVEGVGVMVVLLVLCDGEVLLVCLCQQLVLVVLGKDKDVGQWCCNGVGVQILFDLGLGKLCVLGIFCCQIGLVGYGLEVVEMVIL